VISNLYALFNIADGLFFADQRKRDVWRIGWIKDKAVEIAAQAIGA
jgi:hypothetical protein